MNDCEGRKRALRRIVLAALLLALALAAAACGGGGKSINASSLVSARFEGLNGEGTVRLVYDQDALLETLSQEKALTERQRETIIGLASDLYKDYSISKRDGLSNGDTVEITGGLDKDLLKDLGYSIKNDTVKLTVEGLIDPVTYDVSDYVVLDASGYDGAGEAYAYFDIDALNATLAQRWAELFPDTDANAFQDLTSYSTSVYGMTLTLDKSTGLSNGDAVKGTITLPSGAGIPEGGVLLTAGEYSATISGLEAPASVDLASAVTISFDGNVPNVRVNYEVDYDKPFVRYTSLNNLNYSEYARLQNGDTYTLEITYDADWMLANGFVVSNATATAVVSGLPSLDFTLSGPDDPLLDGVKDATQALADQRLFENANSVQNDVLANRPGWVVWGDGVTELEGVAMAYADREKGVDNEMYLLYHTALPVKRVDGTMEQGDVYAVVSQRGATKTVEETLTPSEDWGYRRFLTREEADAWIDQEASDMWGDVAVVTKNYAETPVALTLSEDAVETAAADLSAEAIAETALIDFTPDYVNRVEVWETMTDPYGNEHANVLALRTGERARVDYQLNGEWDRFTGTLSTYNEAGTEAQMTLYVWGDERILYAVNAYQRSMPPEDFALDVSGVQRLSIQTTCYGTNDRPWLCISDGKFAATAAHEALTERKVPLSDALLVDGNEFDDYAKAGMTTDVYGNAMRDCYSLEPEYNGYFVVSLGGEYTRFQADVTVMSLPYYAEAAAKLVVLADGTPVQEIEGISVRDYHAEIDVDVTGVDVLEFRTEAENENSGRLYVGLGNTLLTGPAPERGAEAEAPETEYAELDTRRILSAAGVTSMDEIKSIQCGDYEYILINSGYTYTRAMNLAMILRCTLAMPRTNRMNAAITALVKDGDSSAYWIGAKRESMTSENWLWFDGEPMTDMSHWHSGEPNNSGDNENCAVLYRDGTWNDATEEAEYPFILQVPAVSGGLEEGLVALGDLPRLNEAYLEQVSGNYGETFDPLALRLNAYNDACATFDLGGAYAALSLDACVLDESEANSRGCLAIFGDGKLLYRATGLRRSDPERHIEVDVSGVQQLKVMTAEYAVNDDLWIDLASAWLTPAEAPAKTNAAELMGLETVDSRSIDSEWRLTFDTTGGVHPGWIELNAADEAYALYNLDGAYTVLTGEVCPGYDTTAGETAQLRVLVDGQIVWTSEAITRGTPAQAFEIDLTGAKTLRFETSREGENWRTAVYLAGAVLK